jgi:arginase
MHLDADVLDDAIMPAVDYRLPGGLSWEELTTAMHVAVESRCVVGLEVTIYNPKLDLDGTGARGLVKRDRRRARVRSASRAGAQESAVCEARTRCEATNGGR